MAHFVITTTVGSDRGQPAITQTKIHLPNSLSTLDVAEKLRRVIETELFNIIYGDNDENKNRS